MVQIPLPKRLDIESTVAQIPVSAELPSCFLSILNMSGW